MITQEENELLTQVGPGTRMGNLLRRYWHPVGVVSELEKEPVRPVRILGEDLTLFRGPGAGGQGPESNGQGPLAPDPRTLTPAYGLLAERCAHRGIALAYGIPQENGLRCAYHGWTYNTAGQVVDMPFEPACLPLKIKSYPVEELGGVLWGYLGPEPAPLVTRYDLYVRDDLDKDITITPLPCNWLQCMDNSMDPVHFEHLHGVYGNYVFKKQGKPPAMLTPRHLKIDFDIFEYGVMKRRLVEGDPEDCDDWTVGHPVLFPNILAQGDADRMAFQIRVPVDDTHTLHVTYTGWPRKPGAAPREGIRVFHRSLFNEDGSIVADTVPKQDWFAWVAQGPISDRTREHPVTSDKGVLLFHKLLVEQVEQMERGEDPMAVVRDPAKNVPYVEIRREHKTLGAYHIDPVEERPLTLPSPLGGEGQGEGAPRWVAGSV